MNDLMKQETGVFSAPNNVIVIRCPYNIEELEDYLKKSMKQDRILRMSVGGDTAPDWHQTFLKHITDLALKYRPWQFKWLSQEYGSIEIVWVEVEEWLYKYKE